MKKKVVVLGGGTGTFTVLSGLRKHPLDLTAIVSMADDGGSTGILRDELGVLPPGDVRQCLVALSHAPLLMRRLMNFRYSSGQLKGHSFGNLLLSALEQATGSFDSAVETAAQILRIKGRVIPVTLDKVTLVAHLNGSIVRGQNNIHNTNLKELKTIELEPSSNVNPKAVKAISEADMIVVGPGDFYSSLIPNLLVSGVSEAIQASKAKKVFICSLMTKAGHTDNFSVIDFTSTIEGYLGGNFDYVIYNNRAAPKELINRYAREGEFPVSSDMVNASVGTKFVGADLLNRRISKPETPDLMERNLIRHHPDRLAKLLTVILKRNYDKAEVSGV